RGPVHGWQYLFSRYIAQMMQIVFQHPLLDGHLCVTVQMLNAAAATNPEVRTGGRYPQAGRMEHGLKLSLVMIFTLFQHTGANLLARQRTGNKDHLAISVRHALPAEVQRFDGKDIRHETCPQKKNRAILARLNETSCRKQA